MDFFKVSLQKIILPFLLGFCAFAFAEEKEPRARLEALREEILRVQKILKEKETRKTDLAFAVQQNNAEQKKLEKILKNLQTEKNNLLVSLKDLNQKTAAGQKKYLHAKKQLAELFYAQYLAGQPNYLALILKGKSPNSVARNHFYWKTLNNAHQNSLEALKKDITEQAKLLKDLEKEEARLNDLEKTMQEKEALLNTQKAEKSALLLSVQKEVLQHKEHILSLEKDAQNLSLLLGKLQQFSFSSNTLFQKGALIWPLGADVALPQKSGNGVFLKAELGSPVLATASGRVVFADWLRGFGLLVIVDHGASYLSVYAHNDEILKEVGDWVRQGELLASSGQNVENAQSGVYFEIRHQGQPMDPFLWVKTQ